MRVSKYVIDSDGVIEEEQRRRIFRIMAARRETGKEGKGGVLYLSLYLGEGEMEDAGLRGLAAEASATIMKKA
jgi:hypothetical protein